MQVSAGVAKICAGVAELADALDLGSSAFGCVSSSLSARTKLNFRFYARVAHLVERRLAKAKVAGSSPVSRSIEILLRMKLLI